MAKSSWVAGRIPIPRGAVIASAAKQSPAVKRMADRDCCVASLLAMRGSFFLLVLLAREESLSLGDIHHLQRHDLVRLAGIDDKADRFGGDQGAVRLSFGVECVTPGRSRGLPRFCAAAAFEVEDVLVREGRGDDLDELARRRQKLGEPGD